MTLLQSKLDFKNGSVEIIGRSGAREENALARVRMRALPHLHCPWLPDGKISSLPFLGLRQGGGRGAQSKERKGSNFAGQRSGAIVQKPEGPYTYENPAIANWQPWHRRRQRRRRRSRRRRRAWRWRRAHLTSINLLHVTTVLKPPTTLF